MSACPLSDSGVVHAGDMEAMVRGNRPSRPKRKARPDPLERIPWEREEYLTPMRLLADLEAPMILTLEGVSQQLCRLVRAYTWRDAGQGGGVADEGCGVGGWLRNPN